MANFTAGSFYYGLHEELPTKGNPGSFYYTTDRHVMYVADLNDGKLHSLNNSKLFLLTVNPSKLTWGNDNDGEDMVTKISCSGLTADDTPIVDIDLSSFDKSTDVNNIYDEWGKVWKAVANNDELLLYASSSVDLDQDITLRVKVF